MLAEVDRIREGMAVVDAVAYRLARRLGPHVELEELRGIGRLALLRINQTYDPARSTYASALFVVPRSMPMMQRAVSFHIPITTQKI